MIAHKLLSFFKKNYDKKNVFNLFKTKFGQKKTNYFKNNNTKKETIYRRSDCKIIVELRLINPEFKIK